MTTIIEALAVLLPQTGIDTSEIRHNDGAEAVEPHRLRPGTTLVRDLEKATIFAGSGMADLGVRGCDLMAALIALQRAVAELVAAGGCGKATLEDLNDLCQWMLAIACDAYGSAKELRALEVLRDQLERLTPVVLVAPLVPAMFLLGRPDSTALDTIFGRLTMQVVRVGAEVVIIDAAGLEFAGHPAVQNAWQRFLRHDKIAGRVTVVVSGLAAEIEQIWIEHARQCGAPVHFVVQYEEASAIAMQRAGYQLHRV